MSDDKKPQGHLRTKLIVYPRFQYAIIGVNLGILAVTLSAVAISTWASFNKLHQMGVEANLSADHAYFKFLVKQSEQLYLYLGIALTMALLASTIFSIVISHRMAGPLVRLMNYFKAISNGEEVREISFREKDFFTEIPPVINEAINKIKGESDSTNQAESSEN